MTLILWDHPFSPHAQKVKIALREKGLAFDTVVPGGIGAGGAQGDFLAANPRAEVPALIDGDVAVFDSTGIAGWSCGHDRATGSGVEECISSATISSRAAPARPIPPSAPRCPTST